ncbi:MAG: MFS transporter [Oceanicoccus sp.]
MNNTPSADATMRFAKPTLFASVAAVGFAQTVLFAILAPLGREVGLVEMQIGAIISASSLTVFLASPMWGRTSDRWGRKKVILIGLFGYSVGSTLFAGVFQAALWGLLVPMAAFIGLTLARISNAVVMAAVMPASTAYMADITDVSTRTKGISAMGAASNLGSMLGPAVGGLMASITLLTPLYFSIFLTVVAAIAALFVLPETPRQKTTTKPPRLKYTDPRIVPFVIVGIFLFMGFAIVQQTIAFRFQDILNLTGAETAQAVGISMMLSAAASLLMQMVVIPRVKVPPFTLLKIAMPLVIIAFLIMALGETQIALTLAMIIQGFGMGLAGPSFMAGASLAVSPEEQGAVAGIASSCPPLGFTIGPLIGTFLYSLEPTSPYWFALLIYICLFIFTLRAKVGRNT